VAIGVTCVHMISPLVGTFVYEGRFISMFLNATGFSTTYALFVVSLIWLALAHPSKVMRNVATLFSIIGFGMIVLSGTRNATAAVVCAIILLSITFRSKLIWYAIGIGGFLAVFVFLIINSTTTTEVATDAGRLGTITNTRLDVWTGYALSIPEHPFIGWGPGGHTAAFFGSQLQEFAEIFTGMAFAPAVHNAILAQAVSYGLIGMGLFLSIFFYAFWHAKTVVLDRERRIPYEYKVALAMPLAILVTIFLEGAFEDNFGTTRGSVDYLLFYSTALIVGLFSKRFGKDALLHPSATSGDSVEDAAGPVKLVRI